METSTRAGTAAASGSEDRGRAGLPAALVQAKALWRSDCEVNRRLSPRLTLGIWRLGQALQGRPGIGCFLARRVVQVADAVWTRGIIGAELPPQVRAGRRFNLQHAGRGVVIHASCVIGDDCVLHHQVTLGITDAPPGPVLGDGVKFGAGAAAIGSITLADGTRVGTGAVVTKDTEAHCSYGGVPARLITRGTPPGLESTE